MFDGHFYIVEPQATNISREGAIYAKVRRKEKCHSEPVEESNKIVSLLNKRQPVAVPILVT